MVGGESNVERGEFDSPSADNVVLKVTVSFASAMSSQQHVERMLASVGSWARLSLA